MLSFVSSTHYSLVALTSLPLLITSLVYMLLPKFYHDVSKKLKHALITGGSSGIGCRLAEACLERGVKTVTLVARNEANLQKTKTDLQKKFPNQSIVTISADVTDFARLQPKLEKLVQQEGPPTLLFNNAGTSSSSTFIDTPVDEFERLMNVNCLGAVYTCKCLLPSMATQKHGSSIVFVSSMAGQLGIFGCTAYSPSKAALILLGQSLQSEIINSNISVTIAYPPDTDTPGFELENIGKPIETTKTSEGGGLFDARTVANAVADAALARNPPFSVYYGLEGWMLSTLTAGMGPVNSTLSAVTQTFTMGLLRFISLFYLWDFRRIVTKCSQEEQQNKKKE